MPWISKRIRFLRPQAARLESQHAGDAVLEAHDGMRDILVLDFAHLIRAGNRALLDHGLHIGRDRGDIADQEMREAHEMAGDVAERAEAPQIDARPLAPRHIGRGQIILIHLPAEMHDIADAPASIRCLACRTAGFLM